MTKLTTRNQRVKSFFDKKAKNYDELYKEREDCYPTARIRTEKAISLLKKYKTSGEVLDLGCGSGVFAGLLFNEGYQVTGVDVAPKMTLGGCFTTHNITVGRWRRSMGGIQEFVDYVMARDDFETTIETEKASGISVSYKKQQ